MEISTELPQAKAGLQKRSSSQIPQTPLSYCDKDTEVPEGETDAPKQRCAEYKKASLHMWVKSL